MPGEIFIIENANPDLHPLVRKHILPLVLAGYISITVAATCVPFARFLAANTGITLSVLTAVFDALLNEKDPQKAAVEAGVNSVLYDQLIKYIKEILEQKW